MSAARQPRETRHPTPPTLADLAHHPRWVGWRTETVGDRVTKVPKIGFGDRRGRSAKSTDPGTWTTRDRAEAWHRGAEGVGGVGVVLGPLACGHVLCGVDLDTCRDPATGTLSPWAESVIARLNSYAEVSPSSTGVKVFFLLAPVDHDGLRRFMQEPGRAEAKLSRTWKWSGSREHPPAIEFYRGDRYFAVTGRSIDDAYGELRVVSLDDVRGLFEEDGPAFEALDPIPGSSAERSGSGSRFKRTGQRDGSRSAVAFGLAARTIREGKNRDHWIKIGKADPEARSWFEEANARQLDRAWENARREIDGEIDEIQRRITEVVDRFNETHMLVDDKGRTLVCRFVMNSALGYEVPTFSAPEEFEKLHRSDRITIGHRQNGAPIEKSVAQVWLDAKEQRRYVDGVELLPGGPAELPGPTGQKLNLWRGFPVRPVAGDWSALRTHLLEINSQGDETRFDYLMNWLALAVQRPERVPGVAIILQGEEGCGKGTVGDAMLRLFGPHGVSLSSVEDLAGKFSGHLEGKVFAFIDEVDFKKHPELMGRVRKILADRLISIHPKGRALRDVTNYLHGLIASNEDIVVEMNRGTRRFVVFPCANTYAFGRKPRAESKAYFDRIYDQLGRGGLGAMLHELKGRDISTFDPQDFPDTPGNREHIAASQSIEDRWWFTVLDRGYVLETAGPHSQQFGRWLSDIPKRTLELSLAEFISERGLRGRQVELTPRFLRLVGTEKRIGARGRLVPIGEARGDLIQALRPRGYAVGSLHEARRAFVDRTEIEPPADWFTDETENDDTGLSDPTIPTGHDPY